MSNILTESGIKTIRDIYAQEKKIIFSKGEIARYSSVSPKTIMRRIEEGYLPVVKFGHKEKEYPKFFISDLIDIDITDEDLISFVEEIIFLQTKKQYFTTDQLARLLSVSIQTINRIKVYVVFIPEKSKSSKNAQQTYKIYDIVKYLVEHRQYSI